MPRTHGWLFQFRSYGEHRLETTERQCAACGAVLDFAVRACPCEDDLRSLSLKASRLPADLDERRRRGLVGKEPSDA